MFLRNLRVMLVIPFFLILHAEDEFNLSGLVHLEEKPFLNVEISSDGTLFASRGEDGFYAYQYNNSTLTEIAHYNLGCNVSEIKCGDNNYVFTLSSNGIDAFIFTGNDFIHKRHLETSGEKLEIKLNNTIFLLKENYGLLSYYFKNDKFIKTADRKIYDGSKYRCLDLAITSDSTVFVTNYWGGLKYYKYTGNALNYLGRVYEIEWDSWDYNIGESGAMAVEVIGDTAVIVSSYDSKPYLYIYNNGRIIKYLGKQTSASSIDYITQSGGNIILYDDKVMALTTFDGSTVRSTQYIGNYNNDIESLVCDTNGTVYTVQGNDGLIIYENNGDNYIKTEVFTELGTLEDVELYNDSTLITASGISGIKAFKYKQDSFEHIDSYFNLSDAIDIEIYNGCIYVVDNVGLKVFDFLNNKFELKCENNSYEARSLDISENGTVFTGSLYATHICAYQIIGDSLTLMAAQEVRSARDILAISNDTIIFSDRNYDTEIYTYGNNSFTHINKHENLDANVYYKMNSGILLAGGAYDGLNAISLKNGQYTNLAHHSYTGYFCDIECDEQGYIYASNNSSLKVFTFDGSFKNIATYNHHMNDLEVSNSSLFFVDEDNGLFALNKSGRTNIQDPSELDFSLKQNYPNPFNPSTHITYEIAENSHVLMDIYNLNGQKIETLVNAYHQSGKYSILWDASNLPSGLYFYTLTCDNFIETKKMLLMK